MSEIHRRERALWRRYMSRCARCPAMLRVWPFPPMMVAAAREGAARAMLARREWMAAHAMLEVERRQRAWAWWREAEAMREGAAF